MPQSLSKIWLHCIFSVKHRQNLITNDHRKELQSYIIGTLSGLNSYVKEIYANSDHVHILCTLPRTITVLELISKTKSSSSKFMKSKECEEFTWQRGYEVFSVSSSKVDIVRKYSTSTSSVYYAHTYRCVTPFLIQKSDKFQRYEVPTCKKHRAQPYDIIRNKT